jgi:hypothetical protein
MGTPRAAERLRFYAMRPQAGAQHSQRPDRRHPRAYGNFPGGIAPGGSPGSSVNASTCSSSAERNQRIRR